MALYEDAAEVLRKLLHLEGKGNGRVEGRNAPSQDSRHWRMLLEVLQAVRALRKLRANLCESEGRGHDGGDEDRALAIELKRVQTRIAASACSRGGGGAGGNGRTEGVSGASTVAFASPIQVARREHATQAVKQALDRRRLLREALKQEKSEEAVLSLAHVFAADLAQGRSISTPASGAISAFARSLETAESCRELWNACDKLRASCREFGWKVVD